MLPNNLSAENAFAMKLNSMQAAEGQGLQRLSRTQTALQGLHVPASNRDRSYFGMFRAAAVSNAMTIISSCNAMTHLAAQEVHADAM